MRILLDEQLPRRLARELAGHDVRTVQQQGWAGLGNGELLRRAAADAFEVFVTADQNVEFQQNLALSPVCVVLLVARSNALKALVPLVPALRQAIRNPQPGQVRRVAAAWGVTGFRTPPWRPTRRSSRRASRRRRRGG